MRKVIVVLTLLLQVSISIFAQQVNWARHFDPENDRDADMTAVTTAGEFTYAFGHSRYPIAVEDPGVEDKLAPGFFLLKLDAEGNTVWKQSITTQDSDWNRFIYSFDQEHDIAVGADGKIYVAGAISSSLTFPGVNGPFNFDILDYSVNNVGHENRILPFVARFNESGLIEAFKIVARVDPETGTNRDIPYLNMMMDGNDIYVAARYQFSIITDPGTSNEQLLYSRGTSWSTAETFFIAKYNTDFELTQLIDVRQPDNTRNEIKAVSMVKAENGIHVLASFSGTLLLNENVSPQNVYSGPNESNGSFAGALIHYDETGNYLDHQAFLQTFDISRGNTFYDLSRDSNGNLYVAGTVEGGGSIGTGENLFEFAPAAAKFPTLLKFDSQYEFQWIRAFVGTGNSGIFGSSGAEGRFVTCLANGCVFGGDTGRRFQLFDINNNETLFTTNANGNAVPFLLQFDSEGKINQQLLMQTTFNSPGVGIDGVTKLNGLYASSDTKIIASGRFTGEISIGAGLESSITLVEPSQGSTSVRDLFITSVDMSVPEAPLVSLSIDNVTIPENDGLSTLTASLNESSEEDITLVLALNGTAEINTDYNISSTEIIIRAGELTGTSTISTIDDGTDELDETIVVSIESVTNGIEDGAQELQLTITDNDDPPTLVLSTDKTQISEASESATITATLSEASSFEVNVTLTSEGDASNADYMLNSNNITIAPGTLSASVTLTSIDDEIDELNESVTVFITEVVNATEESEQQVQITIMDDDPSPSLSLSVDKSQISEAGESAILTAIISETTILEVSMSFNISGSATSTDYSLSSNTIVIPAGSTTGTITITAVDDEMDEDDETLTIVPDQLANAEFDSNSASITIIDDDETVVSIDDDTLEKKLMVSPNPAQHELNIKLPIKIRPWENILITNSNGKTVLTTKPSAGVNEMVLNVRNLKNGIYFLILESEEVIIRKKVMISR